MSIKRQQYMWKTEDRWIWYSRCDHRKVHLKNGRPTNGLALSTQCDNSISTLFCLFDFHPNLNFHCFQLPILLHSVSTRSLSSREIVYTCQTLQTFVRIAVFLNFHCKTNMKNKEKNIISLRSLTTVLQQLEKETAEERWLTHYMIANSSHHSYPTSPTCTRVITGIIQPDNSL